jgi:glycosyltransferase involved in cell wall biosynthesis
MRVLFVNRSSFLSFKGGDTTQLLMTAQELRKLGVEVSIYEAGVSIDDAKFDLIHFFNITRPATILAILQKTKLPFVVSTIYADYSFYKVIQPWNKMGMLIRLFGSDGVEYFKSVAKHLLNKERLDYRPFFWKGQRTCIQAILKRASYLLPNSESEYQRLKANFPITKDYVVIPNGVDTTKFEHSSSTKRRSGQLICAAMIEPRKNQLNLIRAIKNSDYSLFIVGEPAPNHRAYYEQCKAEAGDNVTFVGRLNYDELITYYLESEIHVMPSWFETTGLASLESAFLGCKVVVSPMGDTRDYFEDMVTYCEPGSVHSIRSAIDLAHSKRIDERLKDKVVSTYNWENTARITASVYERILAKK